MAWTRIGGATAGSGDGNSATTAGFDTTGADLLVAFVAWDTAAGAIAFSDSKGNTWNKLTSQVLTVEGSFYWCNPTAVGSGHTFTASLTGSNPVLNVEAWSGSAPSAFDQQNGGSNSVGTTIATGSVTPAQDNELIVAGIGIRGGSTSISSIDSSFTIGTNTAPGGTNDGSAIAYLTQVGAAAVNPTWTVAGTGSVKVACIATFKPGGTHRMFLVFP